MTTISFAIVSDVHAFAASSLKDGEPRPSHMDIGRPHNDPGLNPFEALRQLVQRDGLQADYLISCGDITDKAQPEATNFAWDSIKDVAKRLGSDLIATCGNHDLDSRHKFNDFDARGVLMGLGDFPFSDQSLNNEYWARNVVILEHEHYRFVVLNSAAYHGYNNEYMHGRISRSTLLYLEGALKRGGRKTNILVCHHHPSKVGSRDLLDDSHMADAGPLFELMNKYDYGRWLIIHGHRHWPYITYADGGSTSPVVFSAGSLAAIIYDEIAHMARNQFYLVNLEITPDASAIRGKFRAWDWIADSGFEPAQEASGLPHRGGFGYRQGGDELARDLADHLARHGLPFLTIEEIRRTIPDIDFLAPHDLGVFKRALRMKGHKVLEDQGMIEQVGR